jgi:translation initiation factor 4E
MHPLQTPWTFYYQEQNHAGLSWADSIHKIGKFSTCEDFWSFYSHLQRPGELDRSISLHLFRHDFRAVWEDDANKGGGYFQFRIDHLDQLKYHWEKLILSLIGEQFPSEVIGAVVSIKRSGSIHLWVHNADDLNAMKETVGTFVRCLELPLNRKVVLQHQRFADQVQVKYFVDQNGVERS